MFEWLYHPAAGLVNCVLGGSSSTGSAIPTLALPALILADVWRTMPFVALLCYARLLDDSRRSSTRRRRSTAPAALADVPASSRCRCCARSCWSPLLFRTLDALRAFDLMFVLTGGGPAGTTETLTVYAYRSLFQTLQLGFGSAVGVVVFALVMLVAGGVPPRRCAARRRRREAPAGSSRRRRARCCSRATPCRTSGSSCTSFKPEAELLRAAAAPAEPRSRWSTTARCSSRA